MELEQVALHVRAWVEMDRLLLSPLTTKVALHVRAWVEIRPRRDRPTRIFVALHVRAWVEILGKDGIGYDKNSRPPCEGVGRNVFNQITLDGYKVALHVRAWVEI